MPLKEMAYYQLEPSEVSTFGKTVNSIVGKNELESEPNLIALNNKLSEECTVLEYRSTNRQDNTLDKEVAAADIKRDTTYTKILQHIRGCRKNLDPQISDAAEKLHETFERHNTKLVNLSYESESHYLASLFTELKKPEFSSSIQTLNLSSHIEQLEKDNKEFNDVYNKRISVNSAAPNDAQFSVCVGAIRKALLNITSYIGIMETIKAEKMKPIIDEINAAISELAPKVQARKTRTENEAKKNGNS